MLEFMYRKPMYEVFLFRNATVEIWRHRHNCEPEQSLHGRWIKDYSFGEYDRHRRTAVRRHFGFKNELHKEYRDYIDETDKSDAKFWGIDRPTPWYRRALIALFRVLKRLGQERRRNDN